MFLETNHGPGLELNFWLLGSIYILVIPNSFYSYISHVSCFFPGCILCEKLGIVQKVWKHSTGSQSLIQIVREMRCTQELSWTTYTLRTGACHPHLHILMVMDKEAWHAAVHGVAESRRRLSDWTLLKLFRKTQYLSGWKGLSCSSLLYQQIFVPWPFLFT